MLTSQSVHTEYPLQTLEASHWSALEGTGDWQQQSSSLSGKNNNDRIRLVYHMSEIPKREVDLEGKVFIFH